MKVSIEEHYSKYDCRVMREEMRLDGVAALWVGDLSECPEDAIIGRDLVDCGQVCDFMEKAHAAGKRGEDFLVEIKRIDE